MVTHAGYRKEDIDVSINEDGTQIAISGTEPDQETLVSGWIVYKRDEERRGFRRVFQIPEDVVLDQIKSSFDDRRSILIIEMPKRVMGICGDFIREVTDEEPELGVGTSQAREVDEASDEDGFGLWRAVCGRV